MLAGAMCEDLRILRSGHIVEHETAEMLIKNNELLQEENDLRRDRIPYQLEQAQIPGTWHYKQVQYANGNIDACNAEKIAKAQAMGPTKADRPVSSTVSTSS